MRNFRTISRKLYLDLISCGDTAKWGSKVSETEKLIHKMGFEGKDVLTRVRAMLQEECLKAIQYELRNNRHCDISDNVLYVLRNMADDTYTEPVRETLFGMCKGAEKKESLLLLINTYNSRKALEGSFN